MNVFTNIPVDTWLNVAGSLFDNHLVMSHVCRKRIFLKYCIDLVLLEHSLCSLLDMQLFNYYCSVVLFSNQILTRQISTSCS